MDDDTAPRAANEPLPFQLPPNGSFVSLSHAASWIALQHSVAGPALSALLGIGAQRGRGGVIHDEHMDTAIATAVERLTDLGSGGAIMMRGRFFRDVLDDEIRIFTRRIPPVRLAEYRWFDTLDDSLYRGLGIAWAKDRRELRYPPRDDGHYRFVTVNRTDLMLEFPPENVEPQAVLASFTNTEIDDWIRSTLHTGMKVARNAFMTERRAKGLSATFEARWNAIKRNRVGRPRVQS